MIKPTELKRLLTIASKFNLKHLTIGDVEFEFRDHAPIKTTKSPQDVPVIVKDPDDLDAKMPPDDEMLFASTPYFDVMQAQRKEN